MIILISQLWMVKFILGLKKFQKLIAQPRLFSADAVALPKQLPEPSNNRCYGSKICKQIVMHNAQGLFIWWPGQDNKRNRTID